jgi:hypothetical protein
VIGVVEEADLVAAEEGASLEIVVVKTIGGRRKENY